MRKRAVANLKQNGPIITTGKHDCTRHLTNAPNQEISRCENRRWRPWKTTLPKTNDGGSQAKAAENDDVTYGTAHVVSERSKSEHLVI